MRHKSNHKLILIFLVLAVFLGGTGFFIEAQSKADIIEEYKELDKRDFRIQSSQNTEEEIEILAKEIYCGSQLEKAINYYKELKSKGLCLKIDSIKYNSIEVLDHDVSSAVLLVNSEYEGDYVTVGEKKESMREVEVKMLCQVELARDGDSWKIANTVVLKDE